MCVCVRATADPPLKCEIKAHHLRGLQGNFDPCGSKVVNLPKDPISNRIGKFMPALFYMHDENNKRGIPEINTELLNKLNENPRFTTDVGRFLSSEFMTTEFRPAFNILNI